MKQIEIFCASELELETKLFDYLTIEHKNSLINFDEHKKEFIFQSKFSSKPELLKIYGSILEYDEFLVDDLKEILKISYNQIGIISQEDYGKIDPKTIYSPIENYVNTCCYDSNVPKSIFHFVANLFYKYLSGHLLSNGNKRLSFLFMINTLYYFGYYFFFSKGSAVNYKKYEGVIEKWVEESQNMSLHSEELEKYIDRLAKWIKDNSIIALNWL